MSWLASGYVKKLTKLPSGEPIPRHVKYLLLIIADYYNDETECAWPSVEQLAEDALYDRATIFRILKEAKNLGVLQITPRRRDGHQTSNEYRFPGLIEWIYHLDGRPWGNATLAVPTSVAESQNATLENSVAKPGDPESQIEDFQGRIAMRPEPIVNQQEEPTPEVSTRARARDALKGKHPEWTEWADLPPDAKSRLTRKYGKSYADRGLDLEGVVDDALNNKRYRKDWTQDFQGLQGWCRRQLEFHDRDHQGAGGSSNGTGRTTTNGRVIRAGPREHSSEDFSRFAAVRDRRRVGAGAREAPDSGAAGHSADNAAGEIAGGLGG